VIILLCVGFIGALIGLVRLANRKDVSSLQLLAFALDIAYFPSAMLLILWLLEII
jgi:hypothetical protein